MNRYAFRSLWIVTLLCAVLGITAVAALTQPAGTALADPDSNKAAVEQFIADVALNDDPELFESLFAEDFVGHLPAAAGDWTEPSMLDMKDLVDQFTGASSDLEIESDLLLAEGDLVAQRVTVRGTFASEFFDTPPTDVAYEVSFNIIYRFNENGQIAEMWVEGDASYLTNEVGLTTVTEE